MGGKGGATPEPGSESEPTTDGGDDVLKDIQKLTGELTQKMRDAGEKLQPTDIKAAINSVVAASDLSKLSDSDKNSITKKLKGGGSNNQPGVAPVTPSAPPVAQPTVNEFNNPSGYDDVEMSVDNSPARFRASGGGAAPDASMGESRQRLQTIIERAKANIKNKTI